MRLMVKLKHIAFCWHLCPGKRHDGTENDVSDRQAVAIVFLQVTNRGIVVRIDNKAGFGGSPKKGQHVASGNGRHKRLLRVNVFWLGKRNRHCVRRTRGGHDNSAVKSPSMRPAKAPIDKSFAFGTMPNDFGLMRRHDLFALYRDIGNLQGPTAAVPRLRSVGS